MQRSRRAHRIRRHACGSNRQALPLLERGRTLPTRSWLLSAFPAREDPSSNCCACRPLGIGGGGGYVLPAAFVSYVERADVAAGKQRWYRCGQHALVIEFSAARTTERLEICRVNKVAHLDPVDAVGARIVLARIAHFVSVELAVSMISVDKDRQVDIGIGQHLEQFVARSHRPFEAIALVGARE